MLPAATTSSVRALPFQTQSAAKSKPYNSQFIHISVETATIILPIQIPEQFESMELANTDSGINLSLISDAMLSDIEHRLHNNERSKTYLVVGKGIGKHQSAVLPGGKIEYDTLIKANQGAPFNFLNHRVNDKKYDWLSVPDDVKLKAAEQTARIELEEEIGNIVDSFEPLNFIGVVTQAANGSDRDLRIIQPCYLPPDSPTDIAAEKAVKVAKSFTNPLLPGIKEVLNQHQNSMDEQQSIEESLQTFAENFVEGMRLKNQSLAANFGVNDYIFSVQDLTLRQLKNANASDNEFSDIFLMPEDKLKSSSLSAGHKDILRQLIPLTPSKRPLVFNEFKSADGKYSVVGRTASSPIPLHVTDLGTNTPLQLKVNQE